MSEYRSKKIKIIADVLAYVILFGVPFVAGLIVGHIFW